MNKNKKATIIMTTSVVVAWICIAAVLIAIPVFAVKLYHHYHKVSGETKVVTSDVASSGGSNKVVKTEWVLINRVEEKEENQEKKQESGVIEIRGDRTVLAF